MKECKRGFPRTTKENQRNTKQSKRNTKENQIYVKNK